MRVRVFVCWTIPLVLLGFVAGCAAPPVEAPAKKVVTKPAGDIHRKPDVPTEKRPVKKRPVRKKAVRPVPAVPVEAAPGDGPPAADVPLSPGPEDEVVPGRMMFHYHYYPDGEVYFDTIRHLYFYRDNGAWTMSVALPASFRKNLGASVRLKLVEERPYLLHDEHRRKYPSGRSGGF